MMTQRPPSCLRAAAFNPASPVLRRTLPHRTVYTLVLTVAILWNLAIVTAPWLLFSGHTVSAAGFYGSFSLLCHQRPERSFFVLGHPLGVCNRCTGIYLGALVGIFLFPILTSALRSGASLQKSTRIPNRFALFAALVLVAADVGLELLGLHPTTVASRFLTGAFCGIVAPFYLLPQILEIFSKGSKETDSQTLRDATA